MDFQQMPQILAAVAAVFGSGRLIELFFTRRKVRTDTRKVEVDSASVISSELRQWASAANERAQQAETRAIEVQANLTARVDDLMAKLAAAEDSLDRLEAKILRCQAGPVCPVRTSNPEPLIA